MLVSLFPALPLQSVLHWTSREILWKGKLDHIMFLIRTPYDPHFSPNQSQCLTVASVPLGIHLHCVPSSWALLPLLPRLCKAQLPSGPLYVLRILFLQISTRLGALLLSGLCWDVTLSERSSLTIQYKILCAMCVPCACTHTHRLPLLTHIASPPPTTTAFFTIWHLCLCLCFLPMRI